MAREAGVSNSTASKALSGRGTVSASTRRSVREAALRLGYEPNLAAQMLSRKGKTIGVALRRDPPQIMGMFRSGIDEAAHELGRFGIRCECVSYANNENDFRAALDELRGCDALVFMPETPVEKCAEAVAKLDIPRLALQTDVGDSCICRCVSVCETVVGKLAAQYLSMAAKTPQTAIIAGDRDYYIHRLNIEGYVSQLSSFGISLCGVWESFDDMETARAVTAKILEAYPTLGGIFVTSYVAPAVCAAIADAGRGGVAVIGVDVYPDTAECLRQGSLDAVIFQNQRLQAKTAMELMSRALGGAPPRSDVKIKPELVLRSNLECYL